MSLQCGGGVIVPVMCSIGIRGGADYRYAAATSVDRPLAAREFRLSGGISLGLGLRPRQV